MALPCHTNCSSDFHVAVDFLDSPPLSTVVVYACKHTNTHKLVTSAPPITSLILPDGFRFFFCQFLPFFWCLYPSGPSSAPNTCFIHVVGELKSMAAVYHTVFPSRFLLAFVPVAANQMSAIIAVCCVALWIIAISASSSFFCGCCVRVRGNFFGFCVFFSFSSGRANHP